MEDETRSIPTLASNQNPLFIGVLCVVRGQSFTGIFTCLAARSETGHCTVNARPLLANATDADAGTLISGLHCPSVPFLALKWPPRPRARLQPTG